MNWTKVEQALEEASVYPADAPPFLRGEITNKVFPGGVLLVAQGGEILFHRASGSRSLQPELSPMRENTVFDIASLSKALVTTTLTMQLVQRGTITLDQRLSRIFQTFGSHEKDRITVKHLLTHTSGYPAVQPFYRSIAKADANLLATREAAGLVLNEIFRAKLENVPGKVAKYSDIGFLLLGHLVEAASGGEGLEKLAQQKIFQPLEMHSTGYIDLSLLRESGLEPDVEAIAPTNFCPWRKKLLCGEVQDENAWAIGGVAGHTGVFSNAMDIHLLARELIQCYHGRGTLVERDTMRTFWRRDGGVLGSTWALGWDTPSDSGSSAGERFSRNGVGHLGYTGCSLWIDPERELEIILLTNRVHPSIENTAIKAFRPLIHNLVLEALE